MAKILTVITVLTLVVSLLSACKPTDSTPAPTSIPTADVTTPTTTPPTTPTTPVTQAVDLSASYVKKDNRSILVGISNSGGTAAGSFDIELYATKTGLLTPNRTLVQKWSVSGIPANGSVEKSVSLDDVVIKELRKDTKNLPGAYNVEAVINFPQDSNTGNNKTSASINIANAPVPEKAGIDYTKVYNASNQQEVIDIAVSGPLKPLIYAGLDMSRVTVKILPIAEAKSVYDQTFKTNISWGLRNIAFVHGPITNPEVVVSEGVLPQVLPNLVRELGAIYYIQKNPNGFTIGKNVGAHELYVNIATLYGYSWFGENGMPLQKNISSEVGKLNLDSYLTNVGQNPVQKIWRSLWALYPNGTTSSDVLKQMMDIVNMPDPTDFVQNTYAQADKLDSLKIKADAYWNSMADVSPKLLPADACKVINYPSNSNLFSLDQVKAANEGSIYPVK